MFKSLPNERPVNSLLTHWEALAFCRDANHHGQDNGLVKCRCC
jgi:hypothetical protein